jgi:hypothetical protein
MSLVSAIANTVRTIAPSAGPISDIDLSLADWVEMQQLGIPWGIHQTMTGNREEIERTFPGLVAGAYRSSGVIFACIMTRFLLFSEARFQFQQMRGGQPGDLFGTPELSILEHPWPGAATGDLLAKAILDVDFAGNAINVRRPGRIERLRPDWVNLVIGSKRPQDDFNPWDPDAQLIGITYVPGGLESGEEPMTFTVDEISHFAPIPDPVARFRGMSWITPIIREVMGDSAAMAHKLAYFENGATPSLILQSGIQDPKKFNEHIERFRKAHEGASKAYKTLHLMLGADATVVGSNLRQEAFKETMGHGETRIAAAAGVHPAIAGLSEGLQGSNLNDSVIRAAAKLTGNKTLRPLWRNLSGSLERIVPPLPGSRLWYDARDIPFLAEDIKDAAEVLRQNMLTIESGIRGGFTPESIVDSVTSGDLRRLLHTGLFSVQLRPPSEFADDGGQEAIPPAATYIRIPEYAGKPIDHQVPKPVGDRRAISDFTPTSGVLAQFGRVPRGTILPAAAPHVVAFPSLFEPAGSLSEQARALNDQGMAVPAIAARLDRTERHVRRLLSGALSD